jgi:hypothetical protein
MLEACVLLGQIVALRPHQAGFTFGQIGTDAAPPCALTQAKSGPLRRIKRTSPSVKSGPTPRSRRALTQAKSGATMPHQADFIFGQIGTDATLQVCAYSGQVGASTPHQADFIFGQIGTDAMLQACAYSGQVGASTPHQADFIFGHDDK